jgi:hypothetical protein
MNMMKWQKQLEKLLWQLMEWLLWALISLGFLTWFLWNRERALYELYKVLEEELEKPKTRTMSRSGT